VLVETWHPRFGDGLVICDEGIADLIDQLMRVGITTVESCQGHDSALFGYEVVLVASSAASKRLSPMSP
jgi:hypothetical protein